MAKVIEEVIIVKLSRMVKDSEKSTSVITNEQKTIVNETIPALIEEVINDTSVVVEIAELE